MSLLFSKLRLQIPQVANGKNATITSPRGVNRTVPMTYPLTDVFVAGMDKYTVQAGTGSESFSVGNGKFKKLVTEDASALTVVTMPTKTTYAVGKALNLSGIDVDATIQKGDSTSSTRNVTNIATYNPPDGTILNTVGSQNIIVNYYDVSTSFSVEVVRFAMSQLPYEFYRGMAVVYNNEIHILGSSRYPANHYKWDGSAWVLLASIPNDVADGAAVVFNNEIHVFGGNSANNNKGYYIWNGTSWSSASNLPWAFYGGYSIVYNNNLYLIGGANRTGFYKKNGSSWTNMGTLPFDTSQYSAVVYNNKIYTIGLVDNIKHLYSWNGSSWTDEGTFSFTVDEYSKLVVYDNEIHLLCRTSHYKWNGTSWSSATDIPYRFDRGCAISFDGFMVLLGTDSSGLQKNVSWWDGTSWTVATS